MLISFSGFQSTGKTTATYALAKELKQRHKSTNLWTDIPRRCPLKINEEGRSDTQFWILSSMIKETLELLNIYDFVISDRTPLDCVAYEMATHELRTGNDTITDKALALYHYAKAFLQEQQAEIIWVEKGYNFVDERGRSKHSKFRELSAKWFNNVYEIALQDLDIRVVDMKEVDFGKLATEYISI
jgi:DNA polymerase III delta prime subunit